MNKKIILLSSIMIFSIALFVTYITSSQDIEAAKLDPTVNNFVMADDVNAVLTLKFQEGTEKINFPIFRMTSGMLSQNGPSFEVQGIVGPNSYLHKALDVAWETRKVNSVYYVSPYQYFDVDVSITKKDQVLRNFDYVDCKIKNYRVDTLTDKEEGYTTSKNGFAIIDVIEFQCAGLQPSNPQYDNLIGQYKKNTVKDFGLNHYNMGGNSYAITTFKFDDGSEKISFPIFRTTSQIVDNSGSTFQVEGVIGSYPLLYSAIDEAKDRNAFFSTRNMGHNFFNVDVDLFNSGVLGLTLQYSDCRIKDYKTDTEFNTEEGFTKKNGFAIVDVIDVDCTGLNLVNHGYDNLKTNQNSKKLIINHDPVPFFMVDDLHAVATFDFNEGTEKIDFPVFRQTGRVLSGSYPTFELQGAVDSLPTFE